MIILNVVFIIKNKHVEGMIKSVGSIFAPNEAFEEVSYTTKLLNFLKEINNPAWYALELSIIWCISYVLRKTIINVN